MKNLFVCVYITYLLYVFVACHQRFKASVISSRLVHGYGRELGRKLGRDLGRGRGGELWLVMCSIEKLFFSFHFIV